MRRYTTTVKQSGRNVERYTPYKRKHRVRLRQGDPSHGIKNISPREQLLAELAEREQTLSK